ncbi:MAG: tetratricopeptide repeat protein [Spirochaetota bacterium]
MNGSAAAMSRDTTSGTTISNAQRYTEATYEAVELYNRGDFAGAIERLREMARVNPDNIKVHEVLSYAYLRAGEVERAERELELIREIAGRLNPDLEFPERLSFEDLAAETELADDLEARYRELLRSASAGDMVRNSGIASRLSIKLMARGSYEEAEQVLVRYSDRLRQLRS